MPQDYWTRQNGDTVAFPDILWSRPENRRFAGKLCVIGGHAQSFATTAASYNFALDAGIGSIRAIFPDSLQKLIAGFLPEADFAPSTPSGSFARSSLATWIEHASWADAVLLCGDLGKNSETAIVIESFIGKHSGNTVLEGQAVDTYLMARPGNDNIWLVCEFSQLQKLVTALSPHTPVTSGMDLTKLVEVLHEVTLVHAVQIVTEFNNQYIVSARGAVSSTPHKDEASLPKAASYTAVWSLQHPSSQFEAVSAAMKALSKK